jgi:hypothetical protein
MSSTKLMPYIVILSVALVGCARYSVRRSALVPQPTPTMRTGQPMERAAELSVGMGTLASAQAPVEGDDSAGLHISRHQANGNLRFRPTRNFDLGIILERGFSSGATALASDQPTPDHGDAIGFGTSLHYSIETRDPGFRIGVAADLLTYNIPNVEYRTCVENCEGVVATEVVEKNTMVPVYSVAVTPSWRVHQQWTVHGGVTIRNHPIIARGGTEGFYDTDDLEAGPPNVILSVGAEYALENGIKAAVVVHKNMAIDPVEYGPTVAALITIPLTSAPPKPAPASRVGAAPGTSLSRR